MSTPHQPSLTALSADQLYEEMAIELGTWMNRATYWRHLAMLRVSGRMQPWPIPGQPATAALRASVPKNMDWPSEDDLTTDRTRPAWWARNGQQ